MLEKFRANVLKYQKYHKLRYQGIYAFILCLEHNLFAAQFVISVLCVVFLQGALWHIYAAEDADKIRDCLRAVSWYLYPVAIEIVKSLIVNHSLNTVKTHQGLQIYISTKLFAT